MFPKSWVFLRSVPSLSFLPPAGPPEVAFCGRSNVGKSSLINNILYSKNLARTSNTPGRTQELNFFIPENVKNLNQELPPLAVVDMPGYGYAEAPKAVVKQWHSLIYDYLRGRPSLKRVYLLIDSRRGIKANDEEILDMLDQTAVSYQVTLTKIDKITEEQLKELQSQTLKAIAKRPAAYPEILLTSAQKNLGISALQQTILKAISF